MKLSLGRASRESGLYDGRIEYAYVDEEVLTLSIQCRYLLHYHSTGDVIEYGDLKRLMPTIDENDKIDIKTRVSANKLSWLMQSGVDKCDYALFNENQEWYLMVGGKKVNVRFILHEEIGGITKLSAHSV